MSLVALERAMLLNTARVLCSGNLYGNYGAVDGLGLRYCIFKCKLSNEGDLILAEKMTAGEASL